MLGVARPGGDDQRRCLRQFIARAGERLRRPSHRSICRANVPSANSSWIQDQLDRFFDLFNPSIELAERLIASKSHPQEVALLLCARLDALASSIASEDQSNRDKFIQLLVGYAGHRDLMVSVSAGDLYYELGYHRWLAEGLIPKPGRIHTFSDLNDPVIELLDRSGVPLTVDDVKQFLSRSMRAVADNFRCTPGQPRVKPTVAKPAAIIAALRTEFQRSRDRDLVANLEAAFRPLLARKTVAAIVYDRFRN